MKTITHGLILCLIFVLSIGNFSYALAEETETESFMSKKVPMYKYYYSKEYKTFFLRRNNSKKELCIACHAGVRHQRVF